MYKMDHKAIISILLLVSLCSESSPEPSSQYSSSGFRREHTRGPPRTQDPSFSESRQWSQTLFNYSAPAPNFGSLDPATASVPDEILKTKVPRQSTFYGVPNNQFGYDYRTQNQFGNGGGPPPPPAQPSGYPGGFSQGFPQGFNQGYPQIYKVDNLIIIANAPQQQACMQPSNLRPPLDPNTFPGSDPALSNRFGNEGDEPTKCTWAIVACCAPGSQAVRYSCFELMGCSGYFVGELPCSPRIINAATQAALSFYNTSNNGTVTDNNRV